LNECTYQTVKVEILNLCTVISDEKNQKDIEEVKAKILELKADPEKSERILAALTLLNVAFNDISTTQPEHSEVISSVQTTMNNLLS